MYGGRGRPRVEGFSGAVRALSENMPHALVELGGLRGILSRLQERPVRRGAGSETAAAAAAAHNTRPSF